MKRIPRKVFTGNGITRRDFMKTMAVIGAVASTHGLLTSCSSSSGGSGATETKTLYFDHGHFNIAKYDYYLRVGTKEYKLTETQAEHRTQARATNAFLKSVSDKNMTHHAVDIRFPSDRPLLCHVRYIPKGQSSATSWKIASRFIHHPKAAMEKAFAMRKVASYPSPKAKFYGFSYPITSGAEAYLESTIVGPTDTGASIIYAYPEIISLEQNSGAYISSILLDLCNEYGLDDEISDEGEYWQSYTVIKDASGNPARDSTGSIVQMPTYSLGVMQPAGMALVAGLKKIKDDPNLYVNISKTTASSDLTGKTVVYQDGSTCTNILASARTSAMKSANGLTYTVSDVSTGKGFTMDVDSVTSDASGTPLIKVNVVNSYLRHLGFNVQYLDSAGKVLPLSTFGSFFSKYSSYFQLGGYDTANVKFFKVISAELVAMGIPVDDKKEDVTIPVPPQASSVQVIADTLGHGNDQYTTAGVGTTLTAVFELACPSLFLTMGAGSGYAGFKGMENVEMFIEGLEVFSELLTTIVQAFGYADYDAFAQLGIEIGQKLLLNEKVATYLVSSLLVSLGAAELEDAIPFFGEALNAIGCAACAAEISQTSAECMNSPWNYVKTIKVAKNISVTINHDPDNHSGFPSVATYFKLTAVVQTLDSSGNVVDCSTPITLKQTMPPTTVTAPITVAIPNVPYGGKLSLTVGFYSNTDWLAGQATQVFDNSGSTTSFSLTIKQNQVPITVSTVYSHKEKTIIDSSGKHAWSATTTPPAQVSSCGQGAGSLCNIVNITCSNDSASVGYVWQASNSTSTGQKYFFGNVSTTANPEASAIISSGTQTQFRMVYDVYGPNSTTMNFYVDADGGNYIRQIRLYDPNDPKTLNKKPDYDAPGSNIAWGRLNFSSDALLITHNGTLVSINANANKIEILKLTGPTTDAKATPASAVSGQGIREGLLNGPLCAALTPDGVILVLETANNRIQSFDTSGNPVSTVFTVNGQPSYFAPLKYQTPSYNYIDMAAEYTGYLYLLSYTQSGLGYQYYLDIYSPQGAFLSRTSQFSATRITVSYWRDVFAANLEVLKRTDGITEPSISHWIPSTP